ncbi:Ser-Thr-rich glycosyl-phosphatidyl-inositol-anchored membrane family [Phaffia rhodozyma]|uniref:Ser-Thr-rich glycosyl-phosphatidyl-inositol-anchored membrane family n=1 Tax=Phaffia rhodozyma TaxID=264483 RepID=A0A0F7SY89_PHARH|nr:Ser-Thr-rich glycosyl-phosphatidyl-inositol-anchored membrane family [Phaffia rhodozyma]
MLPLVWAFVLSLAPFAAAWSVQGFFPITSPAESEVWVIGQTNLLSWETGWETDSDNVAPSFDVILHRPVTDSQQENIYIATRVDPTLSSIAIVLGDDVPTGSGFRLTFGDTWQGGIFATSSQFTIASNATATTTVATAAGPTITVNDALEDSVAFATTLSGAPLPTGTAGNGTLLYVTSHSSKTLISSGFIVGLSLAVGSALLGVLGVFAF